MVQWQGAKTFSFSTAAIRQSTLNNNSGTSNAICGQLTTLCRRGLLKEALDVLHDTDHKHLKLSCFTYASLLQLCLDKRSLPVLYAKLGSLQDARLVLQNMEVKNVASWTSMIQAYSKHGDDEEALSMFCKMQANGIQPDHFTFATVLPVCANSVAIEEGKQMHGQIIRKGFESDVFVGSALVDMYAKCGYIENARKVFDEMPKRNVVSWTAIVAGYAQTGDVDQAMELFEIMPEKDVYSWSVMFTAYAHAGYMDKALELFQKTPIQNAVFWNAMIAGYASLLQLCLEKKSLLCAKRVHTHLTVTGFSTNFYLAHKLVVLYAKLGSLQDARLVLDNMEVKNMACWTNMIQAYSKHGDDEEALGMFYKMQGNGIRVDHFTFAAVLPVCANLVAFEEGKQIHGHIIKGGFESDVFVGSALVDMFAKCGEIEDARKVFDKMPNRNVVSWTATAAGYAQIGYVDQAMELFEIMPEQNVYSWSVMITAYTHAGCMNKALELFRKTPIQTVVLWNAMIAGYAQNRKFSEALKFYREMQLRNARANHVTFASLLSACANLAALHRGKEIHGRVVRCRLPFDMFVWNCLIDMYAKCGCINDAWKLFDKMTTRNVVSWTTMIVGYAKHGYAKEALQLFYEMQQSGTKPNNITFVGVLYACCRAGLVDDGKHYFNCMTQDYNLIPIIEHYYCMVDLLGQAGRLDEAISFINSLPMEPEEIIPR